MALFMTSLPPFVDAHVHVWDAERLSYPWLADPATLSLYGDRYLPDDLAGDAEGLPRLASVHVQAEVDHELDPVLETEWLAELRAQTGFPDVCVGYADLRSADLPQVLDRHGAHPFFRGIRQEAWYDPQSTRADIPRENLLLDPRWVAGLDELARRSLSFDLLIWSHQLPQATEIFLRQPELRVVLDHCAMPPMENPQEMGAWEKNLSAFARQVPNSFLKISGLAIIAPERRFHDMGDIVQRCLGAFGPHRCMLASNFPVDRPGGSYRDLWQSYSALTEGLSTSERAQLFSQAALSFYKIDLQLETD